MGGCLQKLSSRPVRPLASIATWMKQSLTILQGEGVYHDSDGSEHVVVPGDVCVLEVGAEHWIENRADQPLHFIALIYNAAGVLNQ